jgi:hypothetical protein
LLLLLRVAIIFLQLQKEVFCSLGLHQTSLGKRVLVLVTLTAFCRGS